MSKETTEEEPFQKIKVTLSEIAIEKLAKLRKEGYFRSDSATIEECIRSMSEIVEEIQALMNRVAEKKVTNEYRLNVLIRIGLRTRRFIRKPEKKLEK